VQLARIGARGHTSCKSLVDATTNEAGIGRSVAMFRTTGYELLRQMRELAKPSSPNHSPVRWAP